MDAIGDHDVFKMISLRGSGDAMGIDPSSDGIDVPITRELGAPVLNIQRPSEIVRAHAAKWHVMTGEELRGIPWAGLGWPTTDLELPDGSDPKFLGAYSSLALSWTRGQLRAMWGLAKSEEAAQLEEHARLIRLAHVIRRAALHQLDPRLLRRLESAPIILPRNLRAFPSTLPTPRSPAVDRKQALAAAKREVVQLRNRIASLEAIQVAAHATLGALRYSTAVLDDRFYAALNARLTSGQRDVLTTLLAHGRPGEPRDHRSPRSRLAGSDLEGRLRRAREDRL